MTIAYDLPIETDDNVITIDAHFKPLNISTMQIMDNDFLEWGGDEVGIFLAERVNSFSYLRGVLPRKKFGIFTLQLAKINI